MPLIREKWKDIQDFEGYYKVSSFGRIKSLDRIVVDKNGKTKRYRSKMLNLSTKCVRGYSRVSLVCGGKEKKCLVHRLVASAFIPNPNNLPEVNHKTFNKDLNTKLSLEWVTGKENIDHYVNSDSYEYHGEKSKSSKLTEAEVNDIANLARCGYSPETIKCLPEYQHMSNGTIQNIVYGRGWKRLTGITEDDFHIRYKHNVKDVSFGMVFRLFDCLQNSGRKSKSFSNYFRLTVNKINTLRNNVVLVGAWEEVRKCEANFTFNYYKGES